MAITATLTKSLLPLIAVAALVSTPASAATPTPAPAKWVKVCEVDEGKQTCTIMQRIVGPGGDLVASISVRQTAASDKVQFIVSMPLGLAVKPGLTVRIDDKVSFAMKYGMCLVAGCYAEVGSNGTLVNALKNGGTLTIVAASAGGKPIALPVTLAGFTKAFDGKGVDADTAKSRFAELARLDIADAQAKLARLKEAKAKAAAAE